MQPYHFVLLLFAVCLIYGIHRAILDVRQEANNDAVIKGLRKAISQMTELSEAFMDMGESAETASEAILRFTLILDSPGGSRFRRGD